MGLFDIFRRKPLSAAKIGKVAKLAANPFAQPEVRMREMQRLLDDGSDAALRGVLKRFAHNAQGHIADEEEKNWLVEALVEKGEAARQPLRHYIETESKLTYALRAYAKLAPQTAAHDLLVVLDQYGPSDHRALEAKLQLVAELHQAALQREDVMLRLLPYLQDHGDDVQFALVELLASVPPDTITPQLQQAAVPQLQALLADPQTSARIARRAAQYISEIGWALDPQHSMGLHALLADTFFIDKKGFVRRRVQTGTSR